MNNQILNHIHDHLNQNFRKCEDRAIDSLYRDSGITILDLDQLGSPDNIPNNPGLDFFKSCVESSTIPMFNDGRKERFSDISSFISVAVTIASIATSIHKFIPQP